MSAYNAVIILVNLNNIKGIVEIFLILLFNANCIIADNI